MHVRASANFIESRAARRPLLFAYPWTQASDYMRYRYMPNAAESLGTIAAFGGQSDYITRDSDRWYLPALCLGPTGTASTACVRYLTAPLITANRSKRSEFHRLGHAPLFAFFADRFCQMANR